MRILASFLTVAFLAFTPALSFADTPKSPSDAEKAAMEDVIKEYLTKEHPEIVMQALQEYQKRDQEASDLKDQEAIKTLHDKIYHDPTSPVGGATKGDVTIVEFFDYQCGYCKMSEDPLEKLLKEDKKVTFIYKDFPILGPMSRQSALAALASVRQNKYVAFHDALMAKKEHLNDEMIYDIAKSVGLDIEKLKKDMQDAAIVKTVDANLDLGKELNVRGTPMFIINDKKFPGALQYEQLKTAVNDARAAAK